MRSSGDDDKPRLFSSPLPSAKPRAMNRTGLFIALGLALVVGLLFGIYPELDLKLAALFYDPATQSFPLKLDAVAGFARDAAMWVAWAFALPAIIAVVVKLVRPDRPMLIPGRATIFLLVTIILSAGILTNLTFKSYWGRPRPIVVSEFNGPQEFVPWWDPRGNCARNCSFFSGEGATAASRGLLGLFLLGQRRFRLPLRIGDEGACGTMDVVGAALGHHVQSHARGRDRRVAAAGDGL